MVAASKDYNPNGENYNLTNLHFNIAKKIQLVCIRVIGYAEFKPGWVFEPTLRFNCNLQFFLNSQYKLNTN